MGWDAAISSQIGIYLMHSGIYNALFLNFFFSSFKGVALELFAFHRFRSPWKLPWFPLSAL